MNYSKYVCFHVFMSNKPFDLFRNMLNIKTVKVYNFIIFYIQINSMCAYISAYSSRFITYAPFFIVLGRLSLD